MNMTEQSPSESTTAGLTKHWEMLGPPPILSSESLEAYNELGDRVSACLRPEDAVAGILVKDFHNFEWEVLRILRHKALVPERRFRMRLEHQQARAQLMASRKKQTDIPATGEERLEKLEYVADGSFGDINNIFEQAASERDHAQGLEAGITYYEQLDKLLRVAIALRNDSLEQIRQYRADLGQDLQRVAEDIEAAAPAKVTSVGADESGEVPLVPSGEAAQ
jgi:hypothetical protein